MKSLVTARLILRQWRESDSKDLYEYSKSELVGPNAGWQPHKSQEESERFIKLFINSDEVYALVLKSENKVIGSLGFYNRKNDNNFPRLNQKEIGYVLNPKYWGNGFIPEAVNKLIEYGFNEINLDMIWCGHYYFNYNSKRVIEKCGFKYKFTINQKLNQLDNIEGSTLYYAISRIDYFNRINS